jgi:hypothetical protein
VIKNETPFKRRRRLMLEMRARGMTLKAIGAAFGVSKARAGQIIAKENAAASARKTRQDRVDRIWKSAAMRVRLMEAGIPPVAAKTIVNIAIGDDG